jgi:hypothetical protein
MDIIVLQHAAHLLSSLCRGAPVYAAQPPQPPPASATRLALCERMMSDRLMRAALQLLQASNDSIISYTISIIHAFAVTSTSNRRRLIAAGALPALTRASASGRHSLRAEALDAVAVLLLHRHNATVAVVSDAADDVALDAAAAARSDIDALLPALLSAAASGDVLIASAAPLLHYTVVMLDEVEQFVAK